MVPVEDKSPPHNLKLELNLQQTENSNQNGNNAAASVVVASSSLSPSAKILNFERQHQQPFHSALKSPPKPTKTITDTPPIPPQRPKTLAKLKTTTKQTNDMDTNLTAENSGSILATGSISGGSSDEGGKKVKMTKIGTTKNAALKR